MRTSRMRIGNVSGRRGDGGGRRWRRRSLAGLARAWRRLSRPPSARARVACARPASVAASAAAAARRSASAACVPCGIEHGRDVDDLLGADDHPRIGLAHQHAVDAERVRRHRVGELLQLHLLEVDEVLLERVVHRAEARDARLAGEGELGSVPLRRRQRHLAGDVEFAAGDGEVGERQHVGLQDLHPRLGQAGCRVPRPAARVSACPPRRSARGR